MSYRTSFKYLRLDIGDFVCGEAEFIQRDFGVLEIPEEPELARQQEHETLADLPRTRCPTDSMDVIAWVVRRVVLNNPVHARNIQSSCCDVCAEKDTRFGVAELEERVCSLLLLLFALSRRSIYFSRIRMDASVHEGPEPGRRYSSGVQHGT